MGSLNGRIITMISLGLFHTIALDSSGNAHAWGSNSHGQIGIGNTTRQQIPVNISTYNGSILGVRLTQVIGSITFSYALDISGNVHSWGRNDVGQLGTDATIPSDVTRPTRVNFGSLVGVHVASIAAGGGNGLAIDSSGRLHIWGENVSGQIGNNTTSSHVSTPVLSASGSLANVRVRSVACGTANVIVLDTSGNIHAWGNNMHGQVGIGNSIQQRLPINITANGSLNQSRIVQVASMQWAVFALDASGRMHSWGQNPNGELCIGTIGGATRLSPELCGNIGSMSGRFITQMGLGFRFGTAIDTTGALHAWGFPTGATVPSHLAVPWSVNSIIPTPTPSPTPTLTPTPTPTPDPGSYPPVALTSSLVISGAPYGNGTYQLTGSDRSLTDWLTVFDKLSTTNWGTSASWQTRANTSVPWVWGGAAVTINSLTLSGPWLRIALPQAITLTKMTLTAPSDALYPKEFYIFGSNNGTTWTQVYYTNSQISGTSNIGKVYNISPTPTTAYSWYWLIITQPSATTTASFLNRISELSYGTL